MRALCAAVLTVQLSTDFGTSEIHCLENQVLNNTTKYNVSKSVLLSTDETVQNLTSPHISVLNRTTSPVPQKILFPTKNP